MFDAIISFLSAMIRYSTPLLFVSLGVMIMEIAGVVNMGAEGMMIIGCLAGVVATAWLGNVWLGALVAMLVAGIFGLLFALLNVLQLVGWTAIMIYDGALAIGGIFDVGRWVWCLVIGALILLWIVVGITDLGWINKITMAALFVLTLVLCKVIFFSGSAMAASGEAMTFACPPPDTAPWTRFTLPETL